MEPRKLTNTTSKLDDEKKPISLKEALRAHCKSNDYNPDVLDILIGGYCRSHTLLDVLTEWYKKTDFSQFTSDSADQEWLDILFTKVKWFFSHRDFFSQNKQREKLILFFKKYPKYGSSDISKTLEEGHCDGFAFLVANALVLQYLFPDITAGIDNWDFVKKVFYLLGDWDGETELSENEQKAINTVFWLLYRAQNSTKLLYIMQSDWHKIFSDTRGQVLRLLFPIVVPFSESNIQRLINEVLLSSSEQSSSSSSSSSSSKPRTKSEIEYMRFGIDNHATVLVKVKQANSTDTLLIYYDSNNLGGPVFMMLQNSGTVALISKMIAAAHVSDSKERLTVRAQMFGMRQRFNSFNTTQFLTETYHGFDSASFIKRAVYASMRCGGTATFNFLVQQKKFKFTETWDDGHNVLHVAAKFGRTGPAIVALDLDKGLADAKTTHSGRTPLHFAAKQGSAAMIKLLLENKSQPDAKIKSDAKKHSDWTPLMISSHRGHEEAVQELIKGGADCSLVTPKDESAYKLALQAGHNHIGEVILQHTQRATDEQSRKRKAEGEAEERANKRLCTR